MKQKNINGYNFFLCQQLKSHGFIQANLTCIEKKDHFDLVEKLCEKEDVLTQFMIKCILKAWFYVSHLYRNNNNKTNTYLPIMIRLNSTYLFDLRLIKIYFDNQSLNNRVSPLLSDLRVHLTTYSSKHL